MKHIEFLYYNSPCGTLVLASMEHELLLCDWLSSPLFSKHLKQIQRLFESTFIHSQSSLLNEAISQLNEYFNQQRLSFSLPIRFWGSDFQSNVWHCLQSIPFGETRSYKDIANLMNAPSSIRAVAAAIGNNPLNIIIPCHRVIGTDGSLKGYAGGLQAKQQLLSLESAQIIKSL